MRLANLKKEVADAKKDINKSTKQLKTERAALSDLQIDLTRKKSQVTHMRIVAEQRRLEVSRLAEDRLEEQRAQAKLQ